MHEGEVLADEALVRRLIAEQHPEVAGLDLRRIASTGTDHAVFRLGDDLVVRLPRIGWAEQQVAREAAWLPVIALHLPVAVPVPVAVGEPGHGYPYRWLVSPWIGGEDLLGTMAASADLDECSVARDLARFVRALQSVDSEGGPTPGKRGRDLSARDADVRSGIAAMVGEIDADRAIEVWDAALAAPSCDRPMWLHGDLLPGNVIVRDGRLAGVIDWSPTGVGDPACDLMIAWSLSPEARAVFIDEVDADDATWTRARGWVVEQTVPFIPYYKATLPDAVAVTRQRLAAAIADESSRSSLGARGDPHPR